MLVHTALPSLCCGSQVGQGTCLWSPSFLACTMDLMIIGILFLSSNGDRTISEKERAEPSPKLRTGFQEGRRVSRVNCLGLVLLSDTGCHSAHSSTHTSAFSLWPLSYFPIAVTNTTTKGTYKNIQKKAFKSGTHVHHVGERGNGQASAELES